MRIAEIESFTTPDVGFVKLTADTGDYGWGQISTYHGDITALVLHRQVTPWIMGRRIELDHQFQFEPPPKNNEMDDND